MATQADVREICLSLPGTREGTGSQLAFELPQGPKYRGYCWAWLERIKPRAARVPNNEVLAVRVANLDAKEMLLMADPRKFFTEPHYDGYPAVLLRLKEIGRVELRALLCEAWAVLASKELRAQLHTGKPDKKTIAERPVKRVAPAAKKVAVKKTVAKKVAKKAVKKAAKKVARR